MPVDTYCNCHKPLSEIDDDDEWMIACDFCDRWYHGTCVSISQQDDGELIEQYCCPDCFGQGNGRTSWKRKCKLPGCRQPALFDARVPGKKSKYCCDEHGVAWFKLNLTTASSSLLSSTSSNGTVRINQAISEPDLAALVFAASNVTEFKDLGNQLPAATLGSRARDDIVDQRQQATRLSQIDCEVARLQAHMTHVQKRASYVYFARVRSQHAQRKHACMFDRKLILDDEDEWPAWSDSLAGNRLCLAVQQYRVLIDRRRKDELAAWESGRDEGRKKKKRKVKFEQPPNHDNDKNDNDNNNNNNNNDDDDDICYLDKRKCQRHSGWQHVRQEEVDLDLKICQDQINKLVRERQVVQHGQLVSKFKDSFLGAGRCVTYDVPGQQQQQSS
ncbi:hypothetical protein V1514DRAFT_279857 [Lipomyces japonicus]|uniref:uncharacterized protein n=1 Tax=Lipomyces japonicus TaxID=56871 RepID=UPI0034CDA5AE